ncbi:5'-nucleotidase /3'-nucleotidase /exopolyphosphatase [Hydrogenispora ethanolica]|uniref:5'-nucleotidase SurE n=1 Tax=Hydrogenispora ethanolica TaxID=1082276 RepID=A0A4R1R445_HYDET|nr:5'/3'-nucleotidase SurE [Hydrogenispora ethanolica]TCL60251.1 5'-nucleotidase /3'-nucleotidase /exopolyphosphatase [Hydrogenispora ethanolica]
MEKARRFQVLLTNDDGFYAEGLQTLYRVLADEVDVTIVAPDRERSAVGHGITMHQPLRTTPVKIHGREHWLVNGTPADCVKLAIECILKTTPPDLVIAGINRGPNLGNDVLYSGTVSAAIEGRMNNKPSVAASLAGYGASNDFGPAAAFIRDNLNIIKQMAEEAIMNINFPQENFKGAAMTRLGKRIYQNVFEERIDPRGQTYFWLGGDPVGFQQLNDSDILAVESGFVSLTPLKFDLTDESLIERFCAITFKV